MEAPDLRLSGQSDASNGDIRAQACADCYLCGRRGEPLYKGLTDRLFGAPGKWNLSRCPNPECGLVWLDPMPFEEDIGKAYLTYYTHEDHAAIRKAGLLRGLFRAAKSAYLGTYYRANGVKPSPWSYVAAAPIKAVREFREEVDIPIK